MWLFLDYCTWGVVTSIRVLHVEEIGVLFDAVSLGHLPDEHSFASHGESCCHCVC